MSACGCDGWEPTLSLPRDRLRHPTDQLGADHRHRQRRLLVA
jgi:hypothetical protein